LPGFLKVAGSQAGEIVTAKTRREDCADFDEKGGA
jgi:hypothetical protein